MCGIAGLATVNGLRDSDGHLVDAMLRSLAHRGPDDQYELGDERTLLGARRLSIIDLEGGRQPLTDESGRIVASQNGEIYNYLELQQQLEERGHVLRTRSDTEVIAHLYEDEGPGFVRQLRGMFSIALWDSEKKQLILARDRLGKKPLYWRRQGDRLLYASELKALMVDDDLHRKVDETSLALYLQYQYVPAPRTILEGVAKLPPASVLVWDGGEPRIDRYWSPEYETKTTWSYEDDVARGLELLRDAVRLRLRSDVPVGVFLSGGMDSSVVTALMAEESAAPVRTFSIGFENHDYNELRFADAVAQRYGTIHTSEIVKIDALELLPDLAYHYDEPFADSSAVPTFKVSQLAARELKVVLTGDGGDESFGGYTRYRAQRMLANLDALPEGLVRFAARASRVALTPLGSGSRIRRRLDWVDRLAGLDADERYVCLVSIIRAKQVGQLLGKDVSPVTNAYLLDALRSGPDDQTDRLLRTDLLTYLPEDLLVKMDRATMANSLEARSPLLDHHVVEFAARLPMDRKIHGSNTKALLRSVAKELMPADMVDRPKMGFAVPLGDWFDAELGDRFRELVLAPDSMSRDYMDVTLGETLLDEHQTGLVRHEHQLWALLMFELWARRWMRSEAAAEPGVRTVVAARA